MGRSRRKNALREVLRPLEEAGLPEDWGNFWYGEGELGEGGRYSLSAEDQANLLFIYVWNARILEEEETPSADKPLTIGNVNTRQHLTHQVAERMISSPVADEIKREYIDWRDGLPEKLLSAILASIRRSNPKANPHSQLVKLYTNLINSAWRENRQDRIRRDLPLLDAENARMLLDSIPEVRYLLFRGKKEDVLQNPGSVSCALNTLGNGT